MNKNLIFLCIALIFFIKITSSMIVVNETDLVRLKVKAYDPDSDELQYYFGPPLNEKGEWQTTYGDAGVYNVSVAVSDGNLTSVKNVIVIVNKREEPPIITSFVPSASSIEIDETKAVLFNVSAYDLNQDILRYGWFFDGFLVSTQSYFLYVPTFYDEGTHIVRVVVSDGVFNVTKNWSVNVIDFDRTKLLDAFNDVEVTETETIRFELPDFKNYGLEYRIDEPLGNDGVWVTDYDDAGIYDVKIFITDNIRFNASKTIRIKVNDKDRGPVLMKIKDKVVRENETVIVYLNASDPDGDEISYYAENLPAGSEFKGNKFVWKPNFDVVKKDNLINKLLDKFHILSKSFRIKFIARSKNLSDEQWVKITVYDVNRAPQLDVVPEILVKEGEWLKIPIRVSDPDGDKVKVKFSGWIKKARYKVGYEDAGTHLVRVIASDGSLKDIKNVIVKVEDVNRPPIIKLKNLEVNEGEKLELEINVSDPDGDKVKVYGEMLPKGAMMVDNIFVWRPDYEVTDNVKIFPVVFSATDGKNVTKAVINITVYDTNRAPRIIKTEPIRKFITYNGSKIKFLVKAVDPDNDSLSYTWVFGIFERYNATPVHIRKFTSLGRKKVKVIVSDGKDSSYYEWYVKVIKK